MARRSFVRWRVLVIPSSCSSSASVRLFGRVSEDVRVCESECEGMWGYMWHE